MTTHSPRVGIPTHGLFIIYQQKGGRALKAVETHAHKICMDDNVGTVAQLFSTRLVTPINSP